MTELAKLTEDTPMSPLETAVWWTEFILRHKDFSHLKGAATQATFNEYYMLDVIVFLVLVPLVILCIIILLARSVIRIFTSRSNKIKIKKDS